MDRGQPVENAPVFSNEATLPGGGGGGDGEVGGDGGAGVRLVRGRGTLRRGHAGCKPRALLKS